jgi:hypothetical protein
MLVFLALFLTPVCPSLVSAQSAAPTEYEIKAAFLLNFAKFIDWPSNAFADAQSPIDVCIFRNDPFRGALDEIIRGKNINSRELLARRINEFPGLKACHLVFVSEVEDNRLPEILDSLKGTSAVVVGEGEGFAARGGCIQFFVENNKMRFAINVDAVQRARLTVSSKLLALAKIVHDPGNPKGN